ncbi:hypothetical protein E4031_05120 [Vagococcus xieshaowenii]|nr:hypothetical protein E4031_05120 [Vagococcus xieshaowenii]
MLALFFCVLFHEVMKMLVAEMADGRIINIIEETRDTLLHKRGNKYYCPVCHKEMIIKIGAIKQAHFAHKHLYECQGVNEPETVEHIRGKALLYRWAIQKGLNVQLEYPMPQIDQRPDVWMEDRLAVEFQCSPLSIERLRERNEGYASIGKVCWLLGKQLSIKEKITNLQRAFIKWHPSWGNYLIYLDTEQENIKLLYHIQEFVFTHEVFFSELNLTPDELLLFMLDGKYHRQLFHQWRYSLKEIYLDQAHTIKRALFSRKKEVMAIQRLLYLEGYHLSALHPMILLPSLVSDTSFDNEIIHRIKFIKQIATQPIITKEELRLYCHELSQESQMKFREWLRLLVEVSLLKIESHQLRVIQPINIMMTEEEIQLFVEKNLNNRVFVSRLPHNVVS